MKKISKAALAAAGIAIAGTLACPAVASANPPFPPPPPGDWHHPEWAGWNDGYPARGWVPPPGWAPPQDWNNPGGWPAPDWYHPEWAGWNNGYPAPGWAPPAGWQPPRDWNNPLGWKAPPEWCGGPIRILFHPFNCW